jgi:hypothetical protein
LTDYSGILKRTMAREEKKENKRGAMRDIKRKSQRREESAFNFGELISL